MGRNGCRGEKIIPWTFAFDLFAHTKRSFLNKFKGELVSKFAAQTNAKLLIPMKIIISAKSVYPFHPFGGVQKYVYYFAKHLVTQGADVEIVAPCDSGKSRQEIFEGIRYTLLKPTIYHYLEYPIGWLGVHLFSLSLAKYLRNKDFDILHSFDMTAYQYARQKNHRPVIAQIFTDNYLCNPISSLNPLKFFHFTGTQFANIKDQKIVLSRSSRLSVKIKYFLQYWLKIKPMRKLLRESARVFVEAETFKKDIVSLFELEEAKCSVLALGIDFVAIQTACKDQPLTREDIGLKKENCVLITVNRLAADKGVDKIILAMAQIVPRNPQVKLIIIGSGYQEKEIAQLIQRHNLSQHVIHIKNIDEKKLYSFYKISDIFICAFSYPGSSMSTLEAMASGLAVITTAQSWLVREDANGLFLDSNSPEIIARAVVWLIKEDRFRERGKLSQEIVQQYTWSSIAQRAIKEYERLLVNSPRMDSFVVSETESFPHGHKIVARSAYFDVCGVPVSAINLQEACRQIDEWIKKKEQRYICIAPVATIVDVQGNEDYRQVVTRADMITPDGMPLVWIGRLKGKRHVGRTYGPDLLEALCKEGETKGYRHYFYGGTRETSERLEINLKRRFPDIQIAGRYVPGQMSIHFLEKEEILKGIDQSGADILWIGLGSPKQDFWMAEHRNRLNVPVMIGVGAAFDFLAGTKPQAPRWIRQLGLEWFYRFCSEPRRLWKRYLIGNSQFIYYLLKSFFKKKDQ